jgi:hypothetical protein
MTLMDGNLDDLEIYVIKARHIDVKGAAERKSHTMISQAR